MGPDADEKSLFSFGRVFRQASAKLQRRGIEITLVHHNNRTIRVGERPEFRHVLSVLKVITTPEFRTPVVVDNRKTK
jgi:hypothetical protein